MNTPVYTYLVNYAKTHSVRPHMPGHKGRPPFAENSLENLYSLDITEIEGADSLFEADGIIAESERNAAELFKTAGTFYSCSGSTLCIQAMLFIMKQEKRKIFAMRNVHRSFINACILLDLEVTWIYPQQNEGILSGAVPAAELDRKLSECSEPSCVYLTSPDYMGNTADIQSISKICRKYDSRLIVDNAHGAHLAFDNINMHPIALGADMCCDSAHKMLPALTGAAYLHVSSEKYAQKAKYAMSVFGSTSPSYLILASLDICNLYLYRNIREDMARVKMAIKQMHNTLSPYYRFSFGDSFHITIHASESGTTGYAVAEYLKNDRIMPEYVDKDYIILLFSPSMENQAIRAVTISLLDAASKLKCRSSKIPAECSIKPCRLRQAVLMREAAFAEYEEIDISEAAGRICAGVKVPCPPAIPIAVCGEEINEECIELYKHYNIKTVYVVKK